MWLQGDLMDASLSCSPNDMQLCPWKVAFRSGSSKRQFEALQFNVLVLLYPNSSSSPEYLEHWQTDNSVRSAYIYSWQTSSWCKSLYTTEVKIRTWPRVAQVCVRLFIFHLIMFWATVLSRAQELPCFPFYLLSHHGTEPLWLQAVNVQGPSMMLTLLWPGVAGEWEPRAQCAGVHPHLGMEGV